MNELKQALKALGIHGHIEVETRFNHSLVILNGKYFGIYDHIKNTFVD